MLVIVTFPIAFLKVVVLHHVYDLEAMCSTKSLPLV